MICELYDTGNSFTADDHSVYRVSFPLMIHLDICFCLHSAMMCRMAAKITLFLIDGLPLKFGFNL